MKAIIIATLAAITIASVGVWSMSGPAKHNETFSAMQTRIAKKTNASNITFAADESSTRFTSQQEVLSHMMPMSTHMENLRLHKANHFNHKQYETVSANLPASFDSQTNWPKCTSINTIRDQSACGSCWAFGAAEAMTDRHCIAHSKAGKEENPVLAAEDINECCNENNGYFSNGCNGGNPSEAWQFAVDLGIVSGGLNGDNTTCKPYKFAPCAHHVTSAKYPACPSSEYSTPRCTSKCTGNIASYSADKRNAETVTNLRDGADMMKALNEGGPITCAFTVYDDFPTYKSGVYVANSNNELGGHAIKVVGYGTLDGVDYWNVANSWNETWGDHGFFKIRRGTDECGIEDQCVAGDMQVKSN